jgi:6-pyruvoyl-tetrahydropterin synthase
MPKLERTETGVGVVLSVAHDPVNAELFGGEVHGHSYEVVVWFENEGGHRDVRVLQAAVETLRRQLDHKKLPPELATGEAIAAYFGTMANVVEVEVRRPLERLYARCR